MDIRIFLLALSTLLLFSCGTTVQNDITQAQKISAQAHNYTESLSDMDREKLLRAEASQTLCSGYTNPYLKPKTEATLTKLLHERGVTECSGHNIKRLVNIEKVSKKEPVKKEEVVASLETTQNQTPEPLVSNQIITKPPLEEGWKPVTTNADYGSYPSDYYEIVKSWYMANLKDPYSAKILQVTKPRKEHAIVNQFNKEAIYGYSVCTLVNAKNSYGGYTGPKSDWFLIRNGMIVRKQDPKYPIYLGHPTNCSDGE